MENINKTSGNKTQLRGIMDILRNAEIRLKPGQPVVVRFRDKPEIATERDVKEVFRSPAGIVRRRRKHMLTTRNGIDHCKESRDKTRNLNTMENGGMDDLPKKSENQTDLIENRRIETAFLRRFAREKLPLSSILREVLSKESDELTVEEFLAKMDIWCLLFKKDIGG